MSLEILITLLVYIVVGGLICYLLWWLIGYLALPDPFNKVARIIVALMAVVFLMYLLGSLVGGVRLVR